MQQLTSSKAKTCLFISISAKLLHTKRRCGA
nr:MAG TPA: hypothetical protein [Caudoviricetes sp.]DAM77578.1 MAG TPA: hypothetical protein [Caudoviricetes sp.]